MSAPDETTPAGVEVQHAGTDQGVEIYEFAGTLEMTTVNAAKDAVQAALDADAPRLVFDLERVRFVDSAGLGFLIGSLRRASEKGGGLVLCGLSAYLMKIFDLVNLRQILKVSESRASALELLKS